MQTKLIVFLSLTMLFVLSGGQCDQNGYNAPPTTGCAGTFFPNYNIRTRQNPNQSGVIVEWNPRGATPGTSMVFRCSYNCGYTGQDGRFYVNYGNFQPITQWIASSHYDGTAAPRTTYYYAVKNHYQPCGEYWGDNVAYITTR